MPRVDWNPEIRVFNRGDWGKMSHFSDFLTWSPYHLLHSVSLFININIGHLSLTMEKIEALYIHFQTFQRLQKFC